MTLSAVPLPVIIARTGKATVAENLQKITVITAIIVYPGPGVISLIFLAGQGLCKWTLRSAA